MSKFEAAKEVLQQGGETGNVFDHVTGLVVKILQDNPTDALSAFENLSFSQNNLLFFYQFPITPVLGGEIGFPWFFLGFS